MMKSFVVADLDVRGELLAKQQYSYDVLAQIAGAAELITTFATLLWRSPAECDTTVPGTSGIAVRWRSSSETCGILTVRCEDQLASLSLLASGRNAEADRLTFDAFQRYLLRELHDTPTEAGFALMELRERPIIATINFVSPSDELDRLAVALADRCFAAAYFRTLDLA